MRKKSLSKGSRTVSVTGPLDLDARIITSAELKALQNDAQTSPYYLFFSSLFASTAITIVLAFPTMPKDDSFLLVKMAVAGSITGLLSILCIGISLINAQSSKRTIATVQKRKCQIE